MTWPTVDDMAARVGVPFAGDADRADADDALGAAIAYVADHSTVYRRDQRAATGTEPVVSRRVHRGTVTLAVALYQRRSASVDPFDAPMPGTQWLDLQRLLGLGRFALPQVI